ncbi:MAG: DUF1932 domain-containing protein [Actinomycetota bacterium]|jgi:3-hydroxyisobutyrate dehydrogenase-like beta-hydroxyacid dehydrogenase|nr:DUF1932 domain-containing protein [Actinomycetota bacterium]
MTTIGIVSPGAMGSALGRGWSCGGNRSVATLDGRSERTRQLAHGLDLLDELAGVVQASDVVVSICPPAQAQAVLEDLLAACAETGARPLLADLNALAPATVVRLHQQAADAGLDLVDGAISGVPPTPDGETRLYLSGPRAGELADLPAPGLVTRVVGDRPGQASGVKMCTASVYKGTTAVLAQALQTAHALGVLDVVLDDLGPRVPDVAATARSIAVATSKSERFVAEMEQIAATQEAAGASPELFAGMAAVYRRLSRSPLAARSPEQAALLHELPDVLRQLGVNAAGTPPGPS